MDDLKVSLPTPCGQKWGDMTPVGAGDHRHCAACDRKIHDLASMTLEEAETLLDGPGQVCVRARVASDGSVALAGRKSAAARGMKAVVGASIALAVAACQTTGGAPRYTVSGTAVHYMSIKIVGEDGYTKRTQANFEDGHFTIKNLPSGTYRLVMIDDCGTEAVVAEGIVIGEATGDADVGRVEREGGCIIVGVLERHDPEGRG